MVEAIEHPNWSSNRGRQMRHGRINGNDKIKVGNQSCCVRHIFDVRHEIGHPEVWRQGDILLQAEERSSGDLE